MMIDFFGTLPGLLSLAGLAALLILVSVVKRLVARARTRRAGAQARSPAALAGQAELPRWVFAAVAAWAMQEAGGGARDAPSAAAWMAVAGGQDPWLAAGWSKVGVTK